MMAMVGFFALYFYRSTRMKSDFPQAHFHLPDSVSFLRMNKPEKFGDSLKDFRFTVNEANASKKTVKGIEAGVSGFGFRVVSPIFYEGNHVGSFEFGKELEYSFLETLKEAYNGDFILYKFEEGGATFISSTVSEEAVDFPYSDKLEAIQNGESVFITSEDETKNYYCLPLKSFDGKTLGFLEFIDDRTGIVAKEKETYRKFGMVVIMMLIAIPILAMLFLTVAFRPLYALVRDAEVIAQGDFTKRFATNRKDKIGMISKSLDHISSGLKDMFHVIGDMSSKVVSTSEEISATGEELAASNEEVHRNVVEVSAIASDQLSSVDYAKSDVQFMADRISRLNESVQRINQSMDSVVSSTKESNERLVEGVTVVQNSKATFGSISTEVQTIVSQVTDITKLVEQIYEKIEALLSSFNDIVDKSDNTMNHISSVKQISENQTAAMKEITHATFSLAEMSEELQEAVSKFKY